MEAWTNGAAREESALKSGVIYVLVNDETASKLVTGVLAMFPGDVPVRAQIKVNGKSQLKEFRQRVVPSDELIKRLENIVGAAYVRYDKK